VGEYPVLAQIDFEQVLTAQPCPVLLDSLIDNTCVHVEDGTRTVTALKQSNKIVKLGIQNVWNGL